MGWETKTDIAKTLAVFGGFTEGSQLFASFAILMNFPRFNKMKGMGQIVTWSLGMRPCTPTLSFVCLTLLLMRILKSGQKKRKDLYKACETVVTHEDAFIDLAFEMGGVEGLEPSEVKDYIRYIGNRRLTQLNPNPIYDIEKIPFRMDEMLNGIEHTNFFENRATEYSKASTTGTWDEAFG